MHYIIPFILSLTILAGCGAPRYSDFFLYRDDGTCKPKVVLLPMGSDAGPGKQLENAIITNARESGALFFYTKEEVQAVLARNSSTNDDLSEIACYFRPADFVVEAILIDDLCVNSERLEIPVIRTNPQEHVVRLRLQIMDIRSEKPKMVLFEVIEERELVYKRDNCPISRPSLYTVIAEKAAARIEDRVLCQLSIR